MKASRRATTQVFGTLPDARERAAAIFGIDIEASFNAWMEDLLGEGGAERLRRSLHSSWPEARVTLKDLTSREREIVSLTACGYTKQEIGDYLHLSMETIKSHLRNAYVKLGVVGNTHAVTMAVLVGELDNDLLREHLFRGLPGFAAPRTPIAA